MCYKERIIGFSQRNNRDLKKFRHSLQSVLFDPHTDCNIHDPDVFYKICQKVLNNHGPRKKKYILEIINYS